MKKTIYNFNTSANTFCNKSTNYSKTLDNLIAADIIKKNSYLYDYFAPDTTDFISAMMKDSAKKHSAIIIGNCGLNFYDDFIKAANFLANYNKKKNEIKSKFILGKTYKLNDGTPIIFYDDEIQIGFDLYSYDDFKNITFLKALPATTKSLIINIININL